MLAPQLVTPPNPLYPAVSLEDLKLYLGETTNEKDILIDSLGRAAEKAIEKYLDGVCLVEQTWSQAFDQFPSGESWTCRNSTMQNALRLRLFPVIEIETVEYYDSAGALQTVSPSAYQVQTDALGAFVASISSPWASSTQSRADAVIVEAKYGYGGPEDVPEDIRTAIKMKVARMLSISRFSGGSSSTSGIVRSETVDGIGSQTFGGGTDIIQIMQRNTEEEEYFLGPYRRSFYV